MEKYSKKVLIIYLIIFGLLSIYAAAAIYIHDPLQVWHKPFFRKDFNTYSYTIRESAKAMIRDYDFDSVIIGNSFFENASARKTSEILNNGGKFFNFAMSGGTAYEKNLILNYN